MKTTKTETTETSATVNTSTEGKSGPKIKFPFGTMKPSDDLMSAFTEQAGFEHKLAVSRQTIKAKTATFYTRFIKKFPKAGLADFARQFDKDVPQDKAGYKANKTYRAIENMFRYMPEVRTGGKAESEAAKAKRIAASKAKAKARAKTVQTQQQRGLRLLMGIVHQCGIPNSLFAIAAQRVGFNAKEIEALYDVKGAIVDVGLATYQLSVRATGVSAAVACAKDKTAKVAEILSVPTPAELASAEKSKLAVKPEITAALAKVQAISDATKGKSKTEPVVVAVSSELPKAAFRRGKGKPAHITLKAGDQVTASK